MMPEDVGDAVPVPVEDPKMPVTVDPTKPTAFPPDDAYEDTVPGDSPPGRVPGLPRDSTQPLSIPLDK